MWVTGIEDTFVPQAEGSRRALDEFDLIRHYDCWQEDIDAAAAIGFDAIRYGIPWYRVQPRPDRYDWEWTDQVLPYIVQSRLTPIADLMHYGTPLWLNDQFLNPGYADRFSEFVLAFTERYSDLIRHYVPVNEPSVTAVICGLNGTWPPYLTGERGYVTVLNSICRGLVQSIHLIRGVRPDSVIVNVEGTGFWIGDEPPEGQQDLDVHRLFAPLELILGRVEEGHFLHPFLLENGMTTDDLAWFARNRVDVDVLGINYYPDGSVHKRRVGTDGEIELEPAWGGSKYLKKAVLDWHKRYGKPILISECAVNERSAVRFGLTHKARRSGVNDGSGLRAWWFGEVLKTVRDLDAAHQRLAGFTWWPLIDAVNWGYRDTPGTVEDYIEPSGLLALEVDRHRLRRRRLKVADAIANAIANDAPAQPPQRAKPVPL